MWLRAFAIEEECPLCPQAFWVTLFAEFKPNTVMEPAGTNWHKIIINACVKCVKNTTFTILILNKKYITQLRKSSNYSYC